MSDETATESEHPEMDRAHAEAAAIVDGPPAAPAPFEGTPERDRDALFACLVRIGKLKGRNFDGTEGLADVSGEGVSTKYLHVVEFANTYKIQ